MTVAIKMTGRLYEEMRLDLERLHPFAAERVGFVLGRIGTGDAGSTLVLLTRYLHIPDAHYLEDETVGARIGPEAVTAATHAVYHGRVAREGIFHVHLHGHAGPTAMSPTDTRGIPPMIPGFQSVGRDAAHGIIILSLNHGSGWVWLPGEKTPMSSASISIIGAPVQVFEPKGRVQ